MKVQFFSKNTEEPKYLNSWAGLGFSLFFFAVAWDLILNGHTVSSNSGFMLSSVWNSFIDMMVSNVGILLSTGIFLGVSALVGIPCLMSIIKQMKWR